MSENQMREVHLPQQAMSAEQKVSQIKQKVASQVLKAAVETEKAIDKQIENLQNLDKGDIEQIRRKRMVELKSRAKKMQTWISKGHGKCTELGDEKEWFSEAKSNERLICLFYRNTTTSSDKYTQILEKHFQSLAPKHMETKFVKINAEKCHFLAQRLNIVLLPTILCTKNNYTHDRIEGFDSLGGSDNFTTETLRSRLAKRGSIDYDPTLDKPPPKKELYTASKTNKTGAAIYASKLAQLGDDDDWDDISD
mmetsp:Transcript_10911/g.16276  ORF Transcript_10911/g.16276 Transcript_10911/m.16276 type:complete len:252 (+) Transcript_10911:49-804(+)